MPPVELRDASTADTVRVEAWDGERLVGHASAHPVRLFEAEHFCDVEVEPDRRREGLGTALYGALAARVPAGDALVTRVLHADPTATGFVRSIGHDLVEHCPAPQGDPTTPGWRTWAAGQRLPDGTVLVGTGDVAAADLEEAWVDYYVWAHETVGRLRDRATVATAFEGLAAHLDHGVSRLVLRGGRIAALSLVFAEPAPDGICRVLAETPHIDEPDGTALVAAVLAGTLDALAARGTRLVELEGRTFDPHLPAVVATFPPHDANPMSVVRLHRPTPAAQPGSASAEPTEGRPS